MYDNLMTRLEERLRRSEEELQNLRVKYYALQTRYEKLKKRCRKFIDECEHAKMTGVRRTVKNTEKENTIKSDTPGLV